MNAEISEKPKKISDEELFALTFPDKVIEKEYVFDDDTPNRPWTDDEIEYLKDRYYDIIPVTWKDGSDHLRFVPVADIAEEINRTLPAVYMKAWRLGLYRKKAYTQNSESPNYDPVRDIVWNMDDKELVDMARDSLAADYEGSYLDSKGWDYEQEILQGIMEGKDGAQILKDFRDRGIGWTDSQFYRNYDIVKRRSYDKRTKSSFGAQKRRKLKYDITSTGEWSKKEEEFLHTYYTNKPTYAIAMKLGRTVKSVVDKARRLFKKPSEVKRGRWSSEEQEYLQNKYPDPNYPIEYISEHLHRTIPAIYNKAKRMGLERGNPDEYNIIKENRGVRPKIKEIITVRLSDAVLDVKRTMKELDEYLRAKNETA